MANKGSRIDMGRVLRRVTGRETPGDHAERNTNRIKRLNGKLRRGNITERRRAEVFKKLHATPGYQKHVDQILRAYEDSGSAVSEEFTAATDRSRTARDQEQQTGRPDPKRPNGPTGGIS